MQRLSLSIAILFTALGIALVGAAFLMGDGARSARNSFTLADTRVRPSWVAVAWGASVEPAPDGLRIRPSEPGRAWGGFRLQRARRVRDPLRLVLDRGWTESGLLAFEVRGGADRT